MWDLPGPGLQPVFPASAGGFLTTAPPGKPHVYILFHILFLINLFIYGLHRTACGISVTRPGIEPGPWL